MSTPQTPRTTSRIFEKASSPLFKKIDLEQNSNQSKQCVTWGFVNTALLGILTAHLMLYSSTCTKNVPIYEYLEYIFATVFGLNAFHYLIKYIRINMFSGCPNKTSTRTQIPHSPNETCNTTYNNIVTSSFSKTPMDLSAASWLSQSFNDSTARSPSASFRGTPQQNISPANRTVSPVMASNLTNLKLNDEDSLKHYLRQYEAMETTPTLNSSEKPADLLSFFWNHPSTKMNKDASSFFTKCEYQLSTPSKVNSGSPKADETTMNTSNQGLDTWRRLNVDGVDLTQWNENLRVWLSQTILCRLIEEFENINKNLHSHGISDVTIGSVGLDRLRKTAQGPILQSIPNLPFVVPFLELHGNQEYLVKRIQELAKGGCMSEYKWNGGSSYNRKDWDISLPTDAAIIMHLVATYLDTQLLPLPNKPDVRSFSGYHFIKSNEKLPEVTANTLAIHEVTVNPPHYRVIIGLETYELVKGYNNLFHSILIFLHHINDKEHGMLGRVNLGRAGVNMLWIIQAD